MLRAALGRSYLDLSLRGLKWVRKGTVLHQSSLHWCPPNGPLFFTLCTTGIFTRSHGKSLSVTHEHTNSSAHPLPVTYYYFVAVVSCSLSSHLACKSFWSRISGKSTLKGWSFERHATSHVLLKTYYNMLFRKAKFEAQRRQTVQRGWDVGHFEDLSGKHQADYKADTGDRCPSGTESRTRL